MCSFVLCNNVIPFYIHVLFHYGLSQDIDYSSLCYIARPCHLSMLYIVVSICYSQTPINSPLHPPLSLGNHKS